LWVSLDESQLDAPIYQIIENENDSLLLSSTDDLTGYLNQQLVGVHTFETIRIIQGSWVDFGEDQVRIINVAGSLIDDNSYLSAGWITDGFNLTVAINDEQLKFSEFLAEVHWQVDIDKLNPNQDLQIGRQLWAIFNRKGSKPGHKAKSKGKSGLFVDRRKRLALDAKQMSNASQRHNNPSQWQYTSSKSRHV
ncbi:MAG: hypothetical protein COW84_11510, partial [Gammaproteobacteria bacterium CG22_combo_CG10-13_8_21_14_all_40_8]